MAFKNKVLDFTNRHLYEPEDPFSRRRTNAFNRFSNPNGLKWLQVDGPRISMENLHYPRIYESNKPFDIGQNLYYVFQVNTPYQYGIKPIDKRSSLEKYADEHPLLRGGQQSKRQYSSSCQMRSEVVAVPASYIDAFKIMAASVDAAFLKADISSRILKIPPSRFIGRVGGFTGALGLVFDFDDFRKVPSFYNGSKLGLGLVLVGLAFFGGPVMIPYVITGSIFMIGWNVGEALYEHFQGGR